MARSIAQYIYILHGDQDISIQYMGFPLGDHLASRRTTCTDREEAGCAVRHVRRPPLDLFEILHSVGEQAVCEPLGISIG